MTVLSFLSIAWSPLSNFNDHRRAVSACHIKLIYIGITFANVFTIAYISAYMDIKDITAMISSFYTVHVRFLSSYLFYPFHLMLLGVV